MKVSYKWLTELTGVNWAPEDMGDRLTLCGTACEYIEPADQYMDKVIVGEITAINPIEGADKIRLATVNLGDSSMDVVCGAPNIEVGQKVPVATEGASLAGGIVIKKTKIRGIESRAMICSEKELDLSDNHSGILVLENNAEPGKPLADLLDYRDFQMTFELTPNRPDSMSAIGLARDVGTLAGKKVTRPEFELTEIKDKAADCIKVSIDDPEACPRYSARVIKNVKIGESPWWMKKKLILCGVRPINNLVDISNYVMLETGQPLHAFDMDLFGSDEVVVRRGKDKEKFSTLDGVEHELTPDVLMITNGKEGVAAGGVMGGLNSEVVDETKNILLEAAYFNPSVIRKSRRQLGFVTESSQRFEKGADPNITPYALNRAAYLYATLAGGEVLSGIVDCYPNKIEPLTLDFRPQRCIDIVGNDIKTGEMIKIFELLDFEVTQSGDKLKVTVPTFRPDIEREIDLIEEIARIRGFDAIPDSITNIGPLYTPTHYDDKFRRELRTVITGAGFDEMISHGLADGKLASLLYPDQERVKILNPVSEELNVMRDNLLITALTVMSHNIKQRVIDLSVFELGKIYFPPDKDDNWLEKDQLVIGVTGNTPNNWRENPRPLDFYDISGAIAKLALHFKWPQISYQPKPQAFFEAEMSFEIISGEKPVGIIGSLKADILKKYDIKQSVTAALLNADYLMSISGQLEFFKPLPIYPAALRDLAMVVDETVNFDDIRQVINKTGGDLVEKVELFDLYKGKQIEQGKKSLAVSITYRSDKGSLLAEQVDEKQEHIISNLKNKFNLEIRDK